MQSKDLSVGLEVAYRPTKWQEIEKATVLETGVYLAPEVSRFATYGRKVPKGNGVRVKNLRGAEHVVDPKTILKPWAEHLAEVRAAKKAAKGRAERRARMLAEHAGYAKAISDAALANGLPPKRGYIYDEEIRDALLAAGFTLDAPRHKGEPGYHFKGAFNSYDKVIEEGEVDLDVVAVAMGLQPAPAPSEYDDYAPETIAAETGADEEA